MTDFEKLSLPQQMRMVADALRGLADELATDRDSEQEADIQELACDLAEAAYFPLLWHEMSDTTRQQALNAAQKVIAKGWRRVGDGD